MEGTGEHTARGATGVALPLSRVRLSLRLAEPAHLPKFIGATLRGAFGHVFRRCVCSTKRPTCAECIVGASCPYLYVFETPVPPGASMMRLYRTAPHPFVIEPPENVPRETPAGSAIEFELILIGRGCEYLPYFVLAFQELGKIGLGPDRSRFLLEKVTDLAPGQENGILYDHRSGKLLRPRQFMPCIGSQEPAPSTLDISLRTPLRLKYEGKLSAELPFHVLMRNLLRRLSALCAFHCGRSLRLDYAGLIARANAVQMKSYNLRWAEFERFSTRQKARLAFGGLLGEVSYFGELTEFMPFLRMGELVHLGKATSFGFGKYAILRQHHGI